MVSNNSIRCYKRLVKEKEDIIKNHSDQLTIEEDKTNSRKWYLSFEGAKGSLYEGEKFKLQFKFSDEYPIDSPEVIFVGKTPVHEHCYSNGFICLSILYTEWSPALKVSSVCLSILSMLSSAKHKKSPPNDLQFSSSYKGSPKSVTWLFDDDKA